MEKFKALAWHFQLLILVGVAALLYGVVYWFVTSETRTETQALTDQITQLQQQNQNARIATERIEEFRTIYNTKSMEYDELKVLLPEEREITNILQGLQDTARDSRLIVMRFTPRDDSQQEFIMAKPVEVEIDTNFANLREFFDKLAKLQRIVSVTDFKLIQLDKQTAERTLHAQFLLTAYYASPENLNNVSSPQTPGQPVTPGQPNVQQTAVTQQQPAPNTPTSVSQ